MKTFKTVLLTAWACFALNFALGQSAGYQIGGKVTDHNSKSVDGATVSLLAAKDSSLIKTLVGTASGNFRFDNVKDGNYFVRVTAIGFGNYTSNVVQVNAKAVNLPVIRLQSASTALKEVSVAAQKDFVEQKIDRTVVNVNALISNTGANALEVLQKAPGVMVDQDGNITFKGKGGVMVMIDDKPTYLSAANLATYLRSLPSSALDKIELMDNPPAKYDAAGNAGVINIKTRKNTIKGFNASFTTAYGIGFYGRWRESLNLNYRVNKVNIFANLGYNNWNSTAITFTPTAQQILPLRIFLFSGQKTEAIMPRSVPTSLYRQKQHGVLCLPAVYITMMMTARFIARFIMSAAVWILLSTPKTYRIINSTMAASTLIIAISLIPPAPR